MVTQHLPSLVARKLVCTRVCNATNEHSCVRTLVHVCAIQHQRTAVYELNTTPAHSCSSARTREHERGQCVNRLLIEQLTWPSASPLIEQLTWPSASPLIEQLTWPSASPWIEQFTCVGLFTVYVIFLQKYLYNKYLLLIYIYIYIYINIYIYIYMFTSRTVTM